MPFVSVTRLRVRSWLLLPAFIFTSLRIGRQAARSQGNLRARLLQDGTKIFWTCTSWESEAAMRAFMLAPPHGPTMRKILEWCDEAALVHWPQDSAELPSWSDAHTRLQRDGRRSKVNHPSAAHIKFEIAAPPPNPKAEIRLK